MHVVSNRLIFDQDGLATGHTQPLVHSYNKGKSPEQLAAVEEFILVYVYIYCASLLIVNSVQGYYMCCMGCMATVFVHESMALYLHINQFNYSGSYHILLQYCRYVLCDPYVMQIMIVL